MDIKKVEIGKVVLTTYKLGGCLSRGVGFHLYKQEDEEEYCYYGYLSLWNWEVNFRINK